MNRRALLASLGGGTSVAFAGCLDSGSEGIGDRAPDDGGENASGGTETDGTDGGTEVDEDGDDRTDASGNDSPTEANGTDRTDGADENDGTHGDGDGASVPEPDGNCGPDAEPLSSALLDRVDQNEGVCHEDLTPSFVVANEREGAVTAAVEITSGEEPIFEGSYSLGASERAIEQDVGAAADLESVTVTVEGDEELSGGWVGTACYRHAAVLTDDGLATGYVSPLAGLGDTQHDCYAGDPVSIRVSNEGSPRTATITVVDHCRESVVEESLPLEDEGVARLEDALTNGGRYDVAVEVEEGGVAVEEFRDACWGLSVSIDGEGEPEIGPVEMD
ncbi:MULTISPECIES: hypothetical protein [Saliphagus]|uniref:Uncharacterized protein n=1 Tax=Saliphagus infecundisoli TaxID=1849069 RepID=A0ABD5QJU8_9EURY|nr:MULTISPECIES: hypothetical protein [Saliphagus]